MAQGKPRFYQPTITRLPSLTVLFLLTLALIGLTELAVRRFPALHSEGIVQTLHEKQQRHEPRLILARNRRPLPQLASNAEEPSNASAIRKTTPLPAASPSFLPSADPSAYSRVVKGGRVSIDHAGESAYLSVVTGGGVTTSSAAPSAYLSVVTDATLNFADPSAYLSVVTGGEIPVKSAVPTIPIPPGGPIGNAAIIEIRPATVDSAPIPGVVAAGSPTRNAAVAETWPATVDAAPIPGVVAAGSPTRNTAVAEIRPVTVDAAPFPGVVAAGSPTRNTAVVETRPTTVDAAPTLDVVATGSQAAEPQSARPQSTGPQSNGPQSARPQSTKPQGNGPQYIGPQSDGPQNARPQSTEPQGNGPQYTGPQSARPQSNGPQSARPQSTEPQSNGPQYAGPQNTRPQSTGPQSNGPQSARPQSTEPQSNGPGPQNDGSQNARPQGTGPQSDGPQSTGAEAAGFQSQPAIVDAAPTPVVVTAGYPTTGFPAPGSQGTELQSTGPEAAGFQARPATVNAAPTPSVVAAGFPTAGFPAPGSQGTELQSTGPEAARFQARPTTVDAAPTPGVVAAGFPTAGFPAVGSQATELESAGPEAAGPEAAGLQAAGFQAAGFQASGFQNREGGQTYSSVPVAGSSPTPRPQTGEVNGATFSIGPSSAVVNGKIIGYATPTTVTVASGQVVVVDPSGAVSIQGFPDQSSPSQPKTSVTRKEYLIGAFLPTVLAVLFSIPWYIMFTAIQEIEPFYRLADPQGALACDSICLDYRASVNVVATFKAGLRGHFVVLWAGLCSIAVIALAPLASETVFIGFVGEGPCTATSSKDACNPQLSVYPVAARAVQGILGLVAVLTIFLAIGISRRNSGVYANPSSVAGIATLLQNPKLIDEFRQLDPDGFDSKALKAQLQGNRYRLGYFQHRDGSTDYGLMRYTETSFYSDETDSNSQYSHTTVPNKKKKYTPVSVNPIEAEPTQSRKPKPDYFLHPATMVAFAIFVAGLLTLVVYYNQTGGDTGFERFMDSQTFGVTFLFTALGVMLKLYWGLIDDDLRATHPYHLLLLASSSSASPKARQFILASPPSNPFTGLVYSLRRMTWLPGWLSTVAVLTEPLIVALANIPFQSGTAYMAYRASTYVTIGVLSFMLLGLVGVLARRKLNGELVRRGTEAARERTVGRIMGLVCGSCMLSEFRGLAELDEKSRDEVVQGWGKRYWMGQLVGVDGVERWGVDEDIFVGAGED